MAARQDRPAVRSPGSGARSMLGMGGLMLIACLGGPALVGALAGLGIGVLLGAGVAVVALALCVAVPTAAVALRRGSIRPPPTALGLPVTTSADGPGRRARQDSVVSDSLPPLHWAFSPRSSHSSS